MTLEARDLVCVRSEREVFSGLNFAVGPGQALVLRGANGSGKTSLLRMVAGFLEPAAGGFEWQGVAVSEDPGAHRARLHYVGHLDALKPALTVAENLAFWAALGGRPGGEGAALARFGLGHLGDIPARLLSAGQRRRLALARVIAAPATLWLLDEPTVSLDDEAIAVLVEVISEHRAEGGMVMVATHVDIGLEAAAVLNLSAARRPREAAP